MRRSIRNCKKCQDTNWFIECICGCGEILTSRKRYNYAKREWIAGHGQRGNYGKFGPDHPAWKGGRRIKNGYRLVNVGGKHERFEHDIIMEKHLRRPLNRDEVVHHKNGIKHDNRIENLEVMKNIEHARMHAVLRLGSRFRSAHEA